MHPFLFTTRADAQRAREGTRQNPEFAKLKAALLEQARTNQVEKLPALERAWWEAAREEPWSDTYPEIFHHTYVVPMKYAELARNCARATLLEDSPELAEKGKQVLLRLADYTFEFEHFDVGLNYTAWSLQALDAYDILFNTFTPPERKRMDDFFMRLLEAVEKNDSYWVQHEPGGKLNNHYAWHKLCFCMLGLFYSKPDLVYSALHGPKGVEAMLQHGFKDDGLWLEGSIPYQFAATGPLLQMAELLDNSRSATSLYNLETADGRMLQQSYDALVPLLWPDRTLPTIGDCYGRRHKLSDYSDFETLFRRFREPLYAWILNDRSDRASAALFTGVPELPRGDAPQQRSALWPEMGYVALRSTEGTKYWSGAGFSVFGTYSHQPVHEHADKLSISLFADGHLWLPDPEARTSAEHAFSAAVQGQLNRHTLAHNTVMLNSESQRPPGEALDLVEFSVLPDVKRASVGDLRSRLYPGVRQLRTILVKDEYVLDFFQLQATEARQIAWLTHVNGRSVTNSPLDPFAIARRGDMPWQYLVEPQGGRAGSYYYEKFQAGADPKKVFSLDLWSDNPLEIVQCGFPLDDSPEPLTIPMRMARCHRKQAWFLAIYRVGGHCSAKMTATVEEGDLNSWKITLTRDGIMSVHIVPRLL